MSCPVLAAFFAMVALVVGGLVLVAGGGDEPSAAVVEPSPSVAAPSPALPSGPPGRPAIPTPEPGREGPETTLVDLQSGATRRLWEPGSIISEAVFSPDGRWIYYVKRELADQGRKATIHRLDLTSVTGSPEMVAEGAGIEMSSRGDLAYTGVDTAGAPAGFVLDRDGVLHLLSPGVGVGAYSWSPDGRWLMYLEGYRGDGVPMREFILDTTTWQERLFVETQACHCDRNPRPIWAPDSRHFIYTVLAVDPATFRRAITHVYGASGNPVTEAPNAQAWLSASVYLASESRQEAGVYRNYHAAVDIGTGAASPIFEAGWGTAFGVSPDGTMMAASDQFTTRVVDRGGNVVLDGVAGEFLGWSPDSRFFLTSARGSTCGAALLVIRVANGGQVACSPAGPSTGGAFSPDSAKVAATLSRWLVTPPPGSATPVTNDLVIVDLSSGTSRTLATDMRGHLRCLTWSPDGRFIVVGICQGV